MRSRSAPSADDKRLKQIRDMAKCAAIAAQKRSCSARRAKKRMGLETISAAAMDRIAIAPIPRTWSVFSSSSKSAGSSSLVKASLMA